MSRKNITLAIEAFRRLKCTRSDTRLIVKTQKLSRTQKSQIGEAINGDARIDWIHRQLSNAEMNSLIALADCLVSTHRSEGFGLALAEAIVGNTPVIGTGWSGNMDFMHGTTSSLVEYEMAQVKPTDDIYGKYSSSDAVWADPHVASVMDRMDQCLLGYDLSDLEVMKRNLANNEKVWNTILPNERIYFVGDRDVKERSIS